MAAAFILDLPDKSPHQATQLFKRMLYWLSDAEHCVNGLYTWQSEQPNCTIEAFLRRTWWFFDAVARQISPRDILVVHRTSQDLMLCSTRLQWNPKTGMLDQTNASVPTQNA